MFGGRPGRWEPNCGLGGNENSFKFSKDAKKTSFHIILILNTFSILANCQNLLISGSREYLVSEFLIAAQLELSFTVFRYFYLVHGTFYSNPSLGIIHTYRMALRPD